MYVTVKDALATPALLSGSPEIMAGKCAIDTNQIRWVHSSEVLEIASLLSGGELLLTGGQALIALKPAAQIEYVRSLAARKIAGLIVETAGTGRHLPEYLIDVANELDLPMIELRRVVPFVDVAEEINRKIVTAQLNSLKAADRLSQSLTEHIAASGPQLQPLLELISAAVSSNVRVIDTDGNLVAEHSPHALDWDSVLTTELSTGSVAVAQLEVARTEHHELIEESLSRVRSIVSLALVQRHRPSLSKLAQEELFRLIHSGGGGDRLIELCQASGLAPDSSLLVAVLHKAVHQQTQKLEKELKAAFPIAVMSADDTWIYVIIPADGALTNGMRETSLEKLRSIVRDTGTTGAIGPTAESIRNVSKSFKEAKVTWRIGFSSKWSDEFYDSADFVVERLAEQSLSRPVVDSLVQEALGNLIQLEKEHGGELVRTLDVWLSTGCNTTDAAKLLFLERQSLHKRLMRIFSALGGDPRGRGKLSGLTIAVKLMRGNARLVDEL